jgi:hypothetical protein
VADFQPEPDDPLVPDRGPDPEIPTEAQKLWWSDNDRVDRAWLRANVAVCLLGSLVLLGCVSASPGVGFSPFDLVPAMLVSAAFTVFVVAIPSRVFLNVTIPERRQPYHTETIVACITFCILCIAAIVVFSLHPSS